MAHESRNVPDMLTNAETKKLEVKRGGRDCMTCFYKVELRNPQNPMERLQVCKRMPPSIALQMPAPGQIALMPLDRMLAPGMWCFEWKLDKALADG
jgi:hypothetical protein